MAAEAAADVAGVRKKSLQRALVQKASELTSPREIRKNERTERRSYCGEHAPCKGMGGRQPRAAVEAVADVPHGGSVVLLLCV